MELIGAEIRNILEMCMRVGTKIRVPLKVNIPSYQRPYRWDEQHITDLIEDFHKNKQETANAEYFVGSVVLVENANSTNRYDIIDGQQRVTTVFLLNYLLFLIQRSYVEEMISTKGPNLDGALTELANIYCSMLGKKYATAFSNLRNTILEKMEALNDLEESERTKLYEDIAEIYRNGVYLPIRVFTDEKKYFDEYEKMQTVFMRPDDLALSYSRKTFNSTLKEALAKVCIRVYKDKDPELTIIGEDDLKNANILQYTNAIKYEFDAIKRHAELTGKPLQNTREIIKYIKDFIENVRFCVIMTGNERDAYTLFEVLNDRAMEIDDLELIKNLFLKAYCKTSGDSDVLIDENIGRLDQIWGDDIFTRDLSDAHKKLISYLGMLYLTADEAAFTNKLERYREIIESKYLIGYSLDLDKYTFLKASNDIRVYQMVRSIIEEYRIPVRNTAAACISAENDSRVSITYKTFHLLNALKLDGVFPVLTNYIICKYMKKMEENGENEINISAFKTYLAEIRDDNQHKKDSAYRDIHDLAFDLWKSALLSKDHEIPREIAKRGLQNAYAKRWNPPAVAIDRSTWLKMLNQFREWTQTWQYNKSSTADLKIKVLFINLFKSTFDPAEKKLTFDKAVYTFTTEKLQLDHMEAQKPDQSNLDKHFRPTDPHEPREKYTNSLGNMMILDRENNNDKDNKPLAEAMLYYENMCARHWLNTLTSQLLEANHTDVSIAGKSFMVPKEKFFTERGAMLQHYFEKIIDRDLDTTKVTV